MSERPRVRPPVGVLSPGPEHLPICGRLGSRGRYVRLPGLRPCGGPVGRLCTQDTPSQGSRVALSSRYGSCIPWTPATRSTQGHLPPCVQGPGSSGPERYGGQGVLRYVFDAVGPVEPGERDAGHPGRLLGLGSQGPLRTVRRGDGGADQGFLNTRTFWWTFANLPDFMFPAALIDAEAMEFSRIASL